jgi:Zn-dependent peptidase ImmA (M78 family)/GNAT superfamily N-acetyltransferase
LDKIEKFNHTHDGNGRFASGNGVSHDTTMSTSDLSEIRLGSALNTEHVSNLAAKMTNGYVGDPVQVETTNHGQLLTDGNHRLAAAIQAGVTEIPVRVYENTDAGRTAANHAIIEAEAKKAGPKSIWTGPVNKFYMTGFTKFNHNHDAKGRFGSGSGDVKYDIINPGPAGVRNTEVAGRISESVPDGKFTTATYTTPGGKEYKLALEHSDGGGIHQDTVLVGRHDIAGPIIGSGDTWGVSQGIMQAADWPSTGNPAKEIQWIEVAPSLRGQGIGTAMVEFARRESDVPIEHSIILTDDGIKFTQQIKSFYQTGVLKYNQNHDDHGRFSEGSSDSRGMTATGNTAKAQAIGDAVVNAANSVHGAGVGVAGNRVAFHQMNGVLSKVTNMHGYYRTGQTGTPTIHIAIRKDNDEYTALHEYGHMVDDRNFKNSGYYNGNTMKAIEGSPTFQNIGSDHFFEQYKTMGPDRVSADKAATYLKNSNETFARAYAQYIATKTGDPALMSGLRASQGRNPWSSWPDEEFKPISAALDKQFGTATLRKDVGGEIHVDSLLGSRSSGVVIRRPKHDGVTRVEKYNHNHDALGRFGTGSGGSSDGMWTTEQTPIADWYASAPRRESKKVDLDTTASSTRAALFKAGIPVVPVKMIGRPIGENAMVAFYQLDRPGVITMNQTGRLGTNSFFGVHEYGHLLDVEHFKSRSQFATGDPGSKLASVMNTIKASSQANHWKYMDNAAYWAKPSEMFARAFAQYVAKKSGDHQMLRTLESQHSAQWSDDDFAPISAEFDKVFAAPVVKSFYMTGFVKFNQNHDALGRFGTGAGGSAGGDAPEWTTGQTPTGEWASNGDLVLAASRRSAKRGDLDAAAASTHAALVKAGVPVVPVHMVGKPIGENAMVAYYQLDNPGVITMNQTSKIGTNSFFGVHEYGHLLDVEHFKSRSEFASGDPGSKVAGVMDKIKASPQSNVWKYWPKGEYWAKPSEMFARAFAQYVATKSGDPKMLKMMASQHTAQWPEADFAPISAEFDNVFKAPAVKAFYTTGFMKFNQNHDERGQFTTGVGGGSHGMARETAAMHAQNAERHASTVAARRRKDELDDTLTRWVMDGDVELDSIEPKQVEVKYPGATGGTA